MQLKRKDRLKKTKNFGKKCLYFVYSILNVFNVNIFISRGEKSNELVVEHKGKRKKRKSMLIFYNV